MQVEKEKTVGYTNPEFKGAVWAGAIKLRVSGQIKDTELGNWTNRGTEERPD